MEGLYPIIRRKRRPLTGVSPGTNAPSTSAKAAVDRSARGAGNRRVAGDQGKERAAEKVGARQHRVGISGTEGNVSGATPMNREQAPETTAVRAGLAKAPAARSTAEKVVVQHSKSAEQENATVADRRYSDEDVSTTKQSG